MANRAAVRSDEGLMMMQELDDRLQEHIGKVEHVRLNAVELKDNLSRSNSDLTQSIADHLEWLDHLSQRVETLHMKTTAFVQMNPKPRTWTGKRSSKYGYRYGRLQQGEDAQSEYGWSPVRARANSDAASEMSCNW
ncbi:uncharacterized protein ACO6RY_06039 [Pungitius sinensis]